MSERTANRFSRRRRGGGALLAALAFLLQACTVGPNFSRPAAPAVSQYAPPEPPVSQEETSAAPAQRIGLGEKVPEDWWQLFHSDRLDEVLREAIAASDSLTAAKATLARAQEAIIQARSAFYPQADLLAGAHRGTNVTGGTSNLFSLGPSVGYLVDAFGLTRRHVEEEAALAESQRDELAAAYLALTGNSVLQSITIASTNSQISTVEDLIRNDEKNLDLVQREFNAGKVAKTDVLTAASQLEVDRTQLPSLRQQLSVARHALSVLASKSPGQWSPPDFEIDEFTLPGDLPVTLPSDLVRQRPDILAAEALLHADSAAIGVATAQMYPSITLSASLTQQALSLANLFQAASRSWDIGANGDAPLFRGGALASQKRAAVDAYNADFATYQQTVLQAFGQVADSLTALEHDGEMVAVSQRAVDIAQQSLALQRSSYAAGRSSVLQLIVAENTYSQARLGFVRAIGQRFSDTAELFVAVGSGWWEHGDSVPGPPAAAAR